MQIIIESDPVAVRQGLARLLASDVIATLQAGARETAEIVLAEVLNNIVEHAYAGQPGSIVVSLNHNRHGVLVQVRDYGAAFPCHEVPKGDLPSLEACRDLPEGGFGWYMIRSLVRDLTYQREDGCNHLSFCLSYNETP